MLDAVAREVDAIQRTDQTQIMCAGYHVKGSPTGERHSTISIADEQTQKVDSVGYGRQNRLGQEN